MGDKYLKKHENVKSNLTNLLRWVPLLRVLWWFLFILMFNIVYHDNNRYYNLFYEYSISLFYCGK